MTPHPYLRLRTLLGTLVILTGLSGCSMLAPKTLTLQVNQLTAHEIEERLSGQDELLMAYSLTSFDKDGKPLETRVQAWGVEAAKNGSRFGSERFIPIALKVPPKGKVQADIALVEVDDYKNAQQLLNQVRQYTDILKLPAGLAELAEIPLVPIKFLSLGVSALGVTLQIAQKLDQDDLLGKHVHLYQAEQQPHNLEAPTVVPFKGSNFGNNYHYELSYILKVRKGNLPAAGRSLSPKK